MLSCNAFELTDSVTGLPIGEGLYPSVAACMNHRRGVRAAERSPTVTAGALSESGSPEPQRTLPAAAAPTATSSWALGAPSSSARSRP